jgi:hypothetical protein
VWQDGTVGLRSLGVVSLFSALVLLTPGCGDGDDGSDGSGGDTAAVSEPDSGCTVDHPRNVPVDPPGYIVACSTDDSLSLRVRNVSSHVLRFRPGDYDTTDIALDEADASSPGVQAARDSTGSGWDVNGETFVLSFDQSLTATSDSPVSLHFEPDITLTAQANVARYYADLVSSLLRTRAQAYAMRVQDCAMSVTSVPGLVDEGASVETLLRGALETSGCYTLVDDALREQGDTAAKELPRIRTQLLQIAKPALKDRLISYAARILAYR